jgi:hypothetical protein
MEAPIIECGLLLESAIIGCALYFYAERFK